MARKTYEEDRATRYARAAALLEHYPTMPASVVAKGIGDTQDGRDDNTYIRAAALLDYDRDMAAPIVAAAINLEESSGEHMRSLYKRWKGDPDLMRWWANGVSKENKAKKRKKKHQLSELDN